MEDNPEMEAARSQTPKANGKIIQEDEIDLLELARTIWGRREFIAKVTGVFLALGILIAVTSKVEYKSSCRLMPENQEGMKAGLGGLGDLAGLAGINLSTGVSGSLTPDLYPEIVKSIAFQLELIEIPILFENKDTLLSAKYYFEKLDKRTPLSYVGEYTVGLPAKIYEFFNAPRVQSNGTSKGPYIRLSNRESAMIEGFESRISVEVDSKTGIITISGEMPDAFASADLTQKVVDKLTQAITQYKIEKASDHLKFVEAQFRNAKNEYEAKQASLAQFAERNRNLSSPLAEIEFQRLQNEMSIAFEVYKGLAAQLEQSKIKVKEETPVFTVLEPVHVPNTKSKPKRMMTLFIYAIFGGFVGIGWVIIRNLVMANFIKYED